MNDIPEIKYEKNWQNAETKTLTKKLFFQKARMSKFN